MRSCFNRTDPTKAKLKVKKFILQNPKWTQGLAQPLPVQKRRAAQAPAAQTDPENTSGK